MSQGRRALDRASPAVEKSRFVAERFMMKCLSTWLVRGANGPPVLVVDDVSSPRPLLSRKGLLVPQSVSGGDPRRLRLPKQVMVRRASAMDRGRINQRANLLHRRPRVTV